MTKRKGMTWGMLKEKWTGPVADEEWEARERASVRSLQQVRALAVIGKSWGH